MVSVVTLERHRAHAQVGGREPDIDIGLHKQGGAAVWRTHCGVMASDKPASAL